MKNIGLNIRIGAIVGSALSGINKVGIGTSSLGAKVDALSKKRVDIIANDKDVLKAKMSLESVGASLDDLKKRKTELFLKLDKEKVSELNNSINKIDDRIDKLKEKENIIQLKIAAETDEKELKKLNSSLKRTSKNILKLSEEKLEIKDELSDVKKANETVNKELKLTSKNIKELNSRELELKDELKKAENQAEKTNRAVKKIDNSIARIKNSKIKIKHIVERREIIKREFSSNLSKVGQASVMLGGVAYGMNAINKETVKMANLSATVGLNFEDVKALNGVVKGIDLNYEHVTDTMEELNNAVGEGISLHEEYMKGDKKKEFKLTGKLDDAFKGLDFSLSDESFKGLNYEKQFLKFSKMAQNEQYKLVFDTALKMPDKQKAASMVDILMGGESNKILSHMRTLGKSYDDILDRGKKLNYLNKEGLEGAKEYAKVSAETSSIIGSMFQQIAGVGSSFMTPVLKDFNEFLILNKDIIQADIKGFFRGVGTAFTKVGEIVDLVSEKVSPFFEMFRAEDTSADDMTFGMDDVGAKGEEVGSTLVWIGAGLAALIGGKMILGTLSMGLGLVSQAVRVLGFAATMNPIGLAIAGIATAGYLIYDNWESISSWWSELWDGIGAALDGKFSWMKTLFSWSPLGMIMDAWTPITTFVSDLWDGMSLADAGSKLIGSFVKGITSKWDSASKAISGIADTVGGWFSFDDDRETQKKPIPNVGAKSMKMATAGFMMGSSLAVATPDVNQTPVMTDRPFLGATNNNNTNNQTIHVTFGDTNISNALEKEDFHANVAKTLQKTLVDAERERNSIKMYD